MKSNVRKLKLAWQETGVGPAPDWFDKEEKRAWDDLVSLAPPSKWTVLDSIGLKLVSMQLVLCRCEHAPDILFDSLADGLSSYLLGPKDFEQLTGKKYPKAWPDPNE